VTLLDQVRQQAANLNPVALMGPTGVADPQYPHV